MNVQTEVKTTEQENLDRTQRKVLEGWVTSDAADKTRTVQVVRRFRHKLYGKVLTRHTKVYAHDETNESHRGDKVSLMETRPMSKLKRWRVVKVLEKARAAQVEEAPAKAAQKKGVTP